MAHATVKAILVSEVARIIAEHEHIPEEEALDKFYASAAAESLADDETGLYGQSALYIYGLFLEEEQFVQKAQ